MKRVLVDTSAYSAFFRGHEGVVDAIRAADRLFVNAIVLGELNAGFLLGRRHRENVDELEAFLASPRVEVLPFGEETAIRYAVIVRDLRKAGTPIPTNDVWIAATAFEHGLRVLTTDRDFERVSGIVVDRFEPGA